ncbi:unnamed protein product, partial [Prorocentrum cordatum]
PPPRPPPPPMLSSSRLRRKVTAETGHAALDATRAPGRAFSIRVRRPATGELTVGPTAGGGLECRRQINHEDLRVQFLQGGDSRTTMTVALSPALVEMLSGGSSSQPEARAQVQAYMERLFEAMREQQSPRELEALSQGARASALLGASRRPHRRQGQEPPGQSGPGGTPGGVR